MTISSLSHLMLLPSLNCPARCGYCFGPHQGSPTMRRETLKAVARWVQAVDRSDEIGITFHGGEPLLAGKAFYETALPLLREGLAPRRVRFGVQSNLWRLTDDLCRLFREYGVSIGTSLDGPEEVNDAQRGAGYFARTLEGIRRARAHEQRHPLPARRLHSHTGARPSPPARRAGGAGRFARTLWDCISPYVTV